MKELKIRRCWIFDLDGTLTEPVHDFAAMRRELGLPEGVGTLEGLAALPPEEQAARRRLLDEIGWRYVELAKAQNGSGALLAALAARGASLGLITRNARRNALATLERIGLAGHFPVQAIMSRDDGAPKPAPDGVLRLLRLWRAVPREAVVVGDAVYDLQAGTAAGVATVLLDARGDSPFRSQADHCVAHLQELMSLLAP